MTEQQKDPYRRNRRKGPRDKFKHRVEDALGAENYRYLKKRMNSIIIFVVAMLFIALVLPKLFSFQPS